MGLEGGGFIQCSGASDRGQPSEQRSQQRACLWMFSPCRTVAPPRAPEPTSAFGGKAPHWRPQLAVGGFIKGCRQLSVRVASPETAHPVNKRQALTQPKLHILSTNFKPLQAQPSNLITDPEPTSTKPRPDCYPQILHRNLSNKCGLGLHPLREPFVGSRA